MFRPNLLQFNLKGLIYLLVLFLFLGILSSCIKNPWKLIPEDYRDKIHFGELSRKRHFNRARRKHSPSYGKYDVDKNIEENERYILEGSHGYDWTRTIREK